MMIHYDLFAGIGGFSFALDQVFYDQKIKHIFCEWEPFPTAVLKKHWPDGIFYGDIHDIIADTRSTGLEKERTSEQTERSSGGSERFTSDTERTRREWELRDTEGQHRLRDRGGKNQDLTILTGGFPCQPFSQAGRRKGTADDRYLWPAMLRVIQNTKHDWVIAENVRGLVTWNEGMVLEAVCTDLEAEGYEVQPLIIPAVAVGAPHRRDRVWIIACHTDSDGRIGRNTEIDTTERGEPSLSNTERRYSESKKATSDTRQQLREQGSSEGVETNQTERATCTETDKREHQYTWENDWREVALTTCHDGVDDGLSRQMDRVAISDARHRKERLKACGNAIVPQVAVEIFKAIRQSL